jgi:hypothetical protein
MAMTMTLRSGRIINTCENVYTLSSDGYSLCDSQSHSQSQGDSQCDSQGDSNPMPISHSDISPHCKSVIQIISNQLDDFQRIKTQLPINTKLYWVELARVIIELVHNLDYYMYDILSFGTGSGIHFTKQSLDTAILNRQHLFDTMSELHFRGNDVNTLELCIRVLTSYIDKVERELSLH